MQTLSTNQLSVVAVSPIDNGLQHRLSQTPLPPAARCAIFNRIWNMGHTNEEFCEDNFAAYFWYYEAQCISLTRGREGPITQNHEYFLNIVTRLQNLNETYDSIANFVRLDNRSFEDSLVCDIVSIAARVWLMLHIGEVKNAITPGQKPLVWKSGSLKECIRNRFKHNSDLTETVKLPKSFNAIQLRRVGGIKIIWSNNLADHLLMRDDDTKLTIFHHASFLRCHRDRKW